MPKRAADQVTSGLVEPYRCLLDLLRQSLRDGLFHLIGGLFGRFGGGLDDLGSLAFGRRKAGYPVLDRD